MKIGKGYIVGTGNEFFGPDYENILEKVSNINYVDKNYCVFYQPGSVYPFLKIANNFLPVKINIINPKKSFFFWQVYKAIGFKFLCFYFQSTKSHKIILSFLF